MSLTGNTLIFPSNLLGAEINFPNKCIDIPEDVLKLKQSVIAQFVMPICRNDWDELRQNMFNMTRLHNKIKELKIRYPNNSYELNYFTNILETSLVAFGEHLDLDNLENEHYGVNEKNFARLIKKTRYIRLKAEYDLYNLIIGKPEKKGGYNNAILGTIKDLLKNEYASFNDIQSAVIEMLN
jgi:hypothetical protein